MNGLPRVRIDVDADRDGTVREDEPGRDVWSWGSEGRGAIVGADYDLDGFRAEDAAPLRVLVEGDAPEGTSVHLTINDVAGMYATLWGAGQDGAPIPLAGAMTRPRTNVSPALPAGRHEVWLQAHLYPDGGFDGLVQIFAELRAGERSLSRKLEDPLDRVLLRVAPWLMPSTLCAPERVYVVASQDPRDDNIELVNALDVASDELGLEPVVKITYEAVGGDVWIQDEIEPGYTHLPGDQARHVILDGPRNRGLDPVAEAAIGDDDIGVYEIPSQQGYRSSLDSFGNLEVSPPVPGYPLGRIVIGTKRPLNREGRRMALEVRQFLRNQHVQPLLETYTDWLSVGHIDEIVAFEPDPDAELGFRVLLASPRSFQAILRELPDDVVLFDGRVRIQRDAAGREVARTDARETAAELLAREKLWAFNDECTEHLAEVRADLVQGLGLHESVFHEVPVAFKEEGGALAYFPDMVNHLILGPASIVPKPYGPSIDGKDPLEEAFKFAAGPKRDVRFVDDWILYHEASGEVHCGTNVRRRPDLDTPWWQTRPPTVYDASFHR
jgi:hypothetical protein